jgi:mRNA interferase RelE/StbE
MARFEIRFKKSVTRDLRRIPAVDVRKIPKRIDALSENPRGAGCIKLAGKDKYRVRQGRYRILYQIEDRELVIYMVKVAHRSNAYKGG